MYRESKQKQKLPKRAKLRDALDAKLTDEVHCIADPYHDEAWVVRDEDGGDEGREKESVVRIFETKESLVERSEKRRSNAGQKPGHDKIAHDYRQRSCGTTQLL